MPCFDKCKPSKRMVWGVFVGLRPQTPPTFIVSVGKVHEYAFALYSCLFGYYGDFLE